MLTDFSDKCSILGNFWLNHREDAVKNEAWGMFFEYNDVALPLAYMLMGNSPIAMVSGNGNAESNIEETWVMLCEFLDIDPDGRYRTVADVFDASPNDPIAEDEDDDIEMSQPAEVSVARGERTGSGASPSILKKSIRLELPV